jgi:large subunit ribosomal protein L18
MFAQIIDDEKKMTLCALSDTKINSGKEAPKGTLAKQLGIELAKKALEKKIKKVVFDKGSYAYHGRVKAVAEGAREGGLEL